MKQKRLRVFALTLVFGSFAVAGIVHNGFAVEDKQGDKFQGDKFQGDKFQGDKFQGDKFQDNKSQHDKSQEDKSQEEDSKTEGTVDRFGIAALHEGEGGYYGGGMGPGYGGGDFHWVQERLERAERMISNLQNRLGYLEQRMNQPPALPQAPPYYPQPYPPANPRGWACSLQDNFGGPHLGRGLTQAEAEYNARKDCISVKSEMFCKAQTQCQPEY